MEQTQDYWAARTCLLAPLPEHEIAAALLSDAASAILATNFDLAHDLIRRADMPVLFEHADVVMNGRNPRVQRKRTVALPTAEVTKVPLRMPSGAATKALFARDGWRCRFCDCRVVPPKARSAMRAALPGAIPWSDTEGFHGAFYALSASVDHVVPHSAGGTNEEDNIVTACWSCQFGRGAWSLDEVGLLDPRHRAPIKDEWDGLTRLLRRPTFSNVSSVPVRSLKVQTIPEVRDVPPPLPRRSRLCDVSPFTSSDAIRATSSKLTNFVDTCADLGVTWNLNKVLLVRMAIGGETLDVIGIGQDGLCEIPWSIGGAKDAFKGFAETLAAALPSAIVYETPKMWRVSKLRKARIDIAELVEVLPAVRAALERLRSELLPAE